MDVGGNYRAGDIEGKRIPCGKRENLSKALWLFDCSSLPLYNDETTFLSRDY